MSVSLSSSPPKPLPGQKAKAKLGKTQNLLEYSEYTRGIFGSKRHAFEARDGNLSQRFGLSLRQASNA